VDSYRNRFNDTPRLGSFLGYVVAHIVRDTINKAGGLETDKLRAALDNARFETIAGPAVLRALDRQLSLGAWVGETTQKGGQGTMKNWKYVDGTAVMFTEAEVKAAQTAQKK
jgi:branched-chain amino acid transport system substrate-binding protein